MLRLLPLLLLGTTSTYGQIKQKTVRTEITRNPVTAVEIQRNEPLRTVPAITPGNNFYLFNATVTNKIITDVAILHIQTGQDGVVHTDFWKRFNEGQETALRFSLLGGDVHKIDFVSNEQLKLISRNGQLVVIADAGKIQQAAVRFTKLPDDYPFMYMTDTGSLAQFPLYQFTDVGSGRPLLFNGKGPNFLAIPRTHLNAFYKLLDSDRDGDGHSFIKAGTGGDDCDDQDNQVHPGKAEYKDAEGKDDDCNPCTVGADNECDRDGDGFISIACFNKLSPKVEALPVCGQQLFVDKDKRIVRGLDCDDNNAAIVPGAVMYVSDTEYNLCGQTEIKKVAAGYKLVRQPDGRALQVPNKP